MEHKDLKETLSRHIGEIVFVEHKNDNNEGVTYDYLVISRVDQFHLIGVVAQDSNLITRGIPYSSIQVVAKSHTYYQNESELLFSINQVKDNNTGIKKI